MPKPQPPPASSTQRSRLWVVPLNDGEAVEIVRLLRTAGERMLVSGQPHGATWEGLEPQIRDEIARARSEDSLSQILGVELAGGNPYGARNIDHHCYAGDDRSNTRSSIEQCAAILGVALDRHQQLVAINDRAWIPGLEAARATPEEIERIRRQDLAAQGLGAADREQANVDLASAVWVGRLALVRCPQGANSFHNDLLYRRADETLLISPEVWSYSGIRHRELQTLGLPEKHWSGGAPERGYFGVEQPSSGSRERILTLLCGEVPMALRTLP